MISSAEMVWLVETKRLPTEKSSKACDTPEHQRTGGCKARDPCAAELEHTNLRSLSWARVEKPSASIAAASAIMMHARFTSPPERLGVRYSHTEFQKLLFAKWDLIRQGRHCALDFAGLPQSRDSGIVSRQGFFEAGVTDGHASGYLGRVSAIAFNH